MTVQEQTAELFSDWRTLKDAAKASGLKYATVYMRLKRLKRPYSVEQRGDGHNRRYRVIAEGDD